MSQDQGQMFDNNQEQTTQTTMFEVNGRGYDAESAKTKIENADQFIEQLKSERQQDADKMKNLEEQLQVLNSKLDKAVKLEDVLASTGQESAPAQPQQVEQTSSTVDKSALLQELRDQLNQEAQVETQASNMKASIEKASKVFGSEWQQKLLEKGKELSMDGVAIETMAKTNPTAFAKLFGLDASKPAPSPAPSGSSVVTGQQHTEAPKSVMFGSSTQDLVAQWRYSGKQVMGDDYNSEVHRIPKRK